MDDCTCGRALIEVNMGGNDGTGRPIMMWQCIKHGGDYKNPDNKY